MLAAAENTGLKLRIVHIPLQEDMVGTTLATSAAFADAHPKEVGGYCRAMTKGLVFTMTNQGGGGPHLVGRISEHEIDKPG